jgi:hypothetical protein
LSFLMARGWSSTATDSRFADCQVNPAPAPRVQGVGDIQARPIAGTNWSGTNPGPEWGRLGGVYLATESKPYTPPEPSTHRAVSPEAILRSGRPDPRPWTPSWAANEWDSSTTWDTPCTPYTTKSTSFNQEKTPEDHSPGAVTQHHTRCYAPVSSGQIRKPRPGISPDTMGAHPSSTPDQPVAAWGTSASNFAITSAEAPVRQ